MLGQSCRYDGILEQLLQDVQLTGKLPAAMLEHILIDRTANAAQCAERKQRLTFVSKPRAGTETIDLLMCAASVGNASVVDALIQAGRPPMSFLPLALLSWVLFCTVQLLSSTII